MRLSALRHTLESRLRHPGWWSAAIALVMFPTLFALAGSGPHALGFYLGFLILIPIILVSLFLCPLPWQWTGDDRPLASWWRGLLQLLGLAFSMGTLASTISWINGKTSPAEAFRLGEILGLSIPFLLLLGPAGWIVARAERLAQEAREAQAKACESQWMSHRGAFSPRLLFSNLNHLATLAGESTRSAEQGLVDLAALYRRWLVEAELPLVPLSTDRSLTEQYLALERQRWGSQLRLRWHLAPELDGLQVPPLFLQPLLEAILEGEPEATLDVDLHEQPLADSTLGLQVRVRGYVPPPGESLLQPLRQRLQATLGREADLAVVPQTGGWNASFRIPPLKGHPQP